MTFEEWQEKHGPNGGAYDIEMQRAGWDGRKQQVEDLAALTARLVRALRKAAPDHDLPTLAMDYLQREGLCGAPLREAPNALVLGVVNITGCAPMISGAMNAALSDKSILEKTENYFSSAPGGVVVLDTKNDLLATSYKARYKNKEYNCSIYYGEVKCTMSGTAREFASMEKSIEKFKADKTLDVNEVPEMTVSQAQMRLNELGYPVGKPDGIFGKMTSQKIKDFQKSHGLRATGVLDAPTQNALK